MHLALAEEILRGDELPSATRDLLTRQRGPFLLGHTAPDVKTVSGQRREACHFYTIPRTSERPAHEALFEAHPSLARAEALSPAHAAFIAGYIAHLLLDELWLDEVFQRYFLRRDWAPRRERLFLHNALRTWADRRDRQRLDGVVPAALREAEPQHWLPFVRDEHLRTWRDWLIEQLSPGQRMRTAEVFAQRMGIETSVLEAVAQSPQQMDERVFRHFPRSALRSFYERGHRRSTVLVDRYIGRVIDW